MDRDVVFRNARYWYPVVAAIASILLNSIAFMIGINWNTVTALQLGGLALLLTMIASGATIYFLFWTTKSSYIEEFTTIACTDEYVIETPQRCRYRRIMTVRVNRDSSHFISYPPHVDGEITSYRAYHADSPQLTYNVSLNRIGGRKVLFIHMDYPLKRGAIIKDLCIECDLQNSFMAEHEGINVETAPGQKSCLARIILPASHPPMANKFQWFVSFGSNPTAWASGIEDAFQSPEGEHVLVKDFSSHIDGKPGLQCALSWRWNPI